MAKKKKEKIVYYDDNSTLIDMSNVTRMGKKPSASVNQKIPKSDLNTVGGTSKWRTYWSATKMMVIPMFIALGILSVLFLFLMLISGNLF